MSDKRKEISFPWICPKGKKVFNHAAQLAVCWCKFPSKACRRAKKSLDAFNLFTLTGGFSRVGVRRYRGQHTRRVFVCITQKGD